MSERLIVLPAKDSNNTQLLKIPPDLERQEAFRCVTSLIAEVEEANPAYRPQDILDALEDHGFIPVPFLLGPVID